MQGKFEQQARLTGEFRRIRYVSVLQGRFHPPLPRPTERSKHPIRTMFFRPIVPITALFLGSIAQGQWSADPMTHLALADSPGGQVQSKIVPTADGGCYVSWFDSISTGFDVRLQRLDVAGNEQWVHGGILVADRSYTSTQDYGLAVDSNGFALLSFRGDSPGFSDEIIAARISPGGQLAWGVDGILLSGGTQDFVAAPKIAGTGDGAVVVAWTQGSDAHLSRLDANGSVQWSHQESTGASGSTFVSDLHEAGHGVILSMVQQAGGFLSPRHLRAIKLDSSGVSTWPGGVNVFDGGSLQIGNFPSFTPDGLGGAVFAWYGTSPLQCYAQHVLSDGTEAYPHNGSAVSANLNQIRVAPSVDHDIGGGNTIVFWEEQNSSQSSFGLSGQKFDNNGMPQWGPDGVTSIPLGNTEIRNVRTVANGSGAYVFWTESTGPGTQVMRGRHVDGASVTDIGPYPVASLPSGKSRPSAALGTSGHALLAWSDARSDAGDILIQNINIDGSLGSFPLGNPLCFGVSCPCGNDSPNAGCVNSTGMGASLEALGSTSVSADNLLLTGAHLRPNSPALLFAGPGQIAGGSGQLFGDGRLCVGGSIQRLGVRFADSSGNATWGPSLITGAGWVSPGNTRFLQIWYRDPLTGPCGMGFNTSHGLGLGFGQ